MRYFAMAERDSKNLAWSHGWGVIRRVHEKLEFVAFFDTREAAEAAAAAAGVDCQPCWLTYGGGLDLSSEKDNAG
jgi:hypothetical protein